MQRRFIVLLSLFAALSLAAGTSVAGEEKDGGWISLFDGKSLAGWMTSEGKTPRGSVEDGAINPHRSGHYMLVHEKQWGDFVLALDFKLSKGCNSGVFVRTFPLTPRPGKDVGYNGIEIALDDTTGAGYHDTGAVYDLSKPAKNAMRPAGEWNQMQITCKGSVITVDVNGERVNQVDLAKFTKPNVRDDGTPHKFDTAFKDHPRKGYIGLQDHGAPCWFKNLRIKPLDPP